MLDAEALVKKHRNRGVLVDTNLLVLFLVGMVNKDRIPDFKRTSDFTIDDYELLFWLISWFGKLIATPHVLSQACDLADLSGNELALVRGVFKIMVEEADESYHTSRDLVADPAFKRLGLADAGIAKVGSERVLVLTSDRALHLALQERKIESLNFNHLRLQAWRSWR